MVIASHVFDYITTHFVEMLRFIIVGVATFFINMFSVFCFYGLLHEDYRIAISFAYVVTVCCHFTLNKAFTFQARERKLLQSAPRYGLMLVLNYFITLFASWLIVGVIGAPPYIGVIASTGGTALSSFFVMKYFVFSQAAETSPLVSRG